MKFKELPIYWDLLKLPFPVLVKRLKNRLLPVAGWQYEVPQMEKFPGLRLIRFSDFPTVGTAGKWKFLLKHYQNDEFDFLGCGWTSLRNNSEPTGFRGFKYETGERNELLAQDLNWNRDHRTGFLFSIKGDPDQELRKAFATQGVDVKFCWEYARLYHLPLLGIMAGIHPEKKEALGDLFKRHIESFRDQNPVGKGINWSSPMEVSIRLVNLLVGYNLLFKEGDEFGELLGPYAFEHLHFVYHHLEHKDGFGTNHYLSNLMGLVVGGYYFSEVPEAREWTRWALKEFERELGKQFFRDGGNFEYSTYYHRLSTEIALITYIFGIAAGHSFSNESKVIIGKAVDFIRKIKRPDGRLPVFGDNDSGRILNLDPEGDILENDFIPEDERCDFISQIFLKGSIYGWFFNQVAPGFELPVFSERPGSLPQDKIDFPRDPVRWEIPFSRIDPWKIRLWAYPKTGIYVFKSEEFYLAVNLMAHPKGHRYRGHIHNDKGSFELLVHGQSLQEDPGVISYTADVHLRNRYRSTKAHNIPWVGIEQNRYIPSFLGLFHSRLDVKTKAIMLSQTAIYCEIKYRGVKHLRILEVFNDRLKVMDWCNKPFTIKKDQNIPQTRGYGKLK